MSKLGIKTQTVRSTTYKEGIINLNTFYDGFEFGYTLSKDWGNFKEYKDEPLINMKIDGQEYKISLNEFKRKLKQVLGCYKA